MEEGFEVCCWLGLFLNELFFEEWFLFEGIVDRVVLVFVVWSDGFVGVVGVRMGEGRGGGLFGLVDGVIRLRMVVFWRVKYVDKLVIDVYEIVLNGEYDNGGFGVVFWEVMLRNSVIGDGGWLVGDDDRKCLRCV